MAGSYTSQLANKIETYKRKGASEAQKHRPTTDATHPDSIEVDLRTQAESFVASEQRSFESALSSASTVAHSIRQSLIDAEADVELALSDTSLASSVDAELATDKQKLIKLAEERIDAKVDLNGFRTLNGITEPARYPESIIYHFGLLILALVAETAINAFFYQNEGGLLGGAIVAFGVSFANLGLAALLGYGFRWKNLADVRWRALGWASLVAAILIALYCNALFATFRSEYQNVTDPSDYNEMSAAFRSASDQAFDVFIFQPDFADMMSFILFIIGLLLSAFAFWKGYTVDDPVPGHSRRDKRLKKAIAVEEAKTEEVRLKLRNFLMDRKTKLQSMRDEPTRLVARANTQRANLSEAASTLKSQADSIQRDFELVLDAYRQSNLAVRGIDPPAYFRDVPSVIDHVDTSNTRSIDAELVETVTQLEAHRAATKDDLNDALTELQTNMAQILGEQFDIYIEAVEKAAKQNLKERNVILRADEAVA